MTKNGLYYMSGVTKVQPAGRICVLCSPREQISYWTLRKHGPRTLLFCIYEPYVAA